MKILVNGAWRDTRAVDLAAALTELGYAEAANRELHTLSQRHAATAQGYQRDLEAASRDRHALQRVPHVFDPDR